MRSVHAKHIPVPTRSVFLPCCCLQPEGFYDFCDENGILIWQDAMFGGSHYPRNPEMLQNIEEEITQQAERLSWHPSVAVWCGSNELELSYEWPNNTMIRSNRNMFVSDLMANVLTLRKAIKKVRLAGALWIYISKQSRVVSSGQSRLASVHAVAATCTFAAPIRNL